MLLHAYSYYPSDGHKSIRIIYAIIDYDNLYNKYDYILMLNQLIHIRSLSNYLVYPLWCNMNGASFYEVPNVKYLSASCHMVITVWLSV